MATTATLMLHLTGQCNLECRHCYMEGAPHRKERLDFDWIVEALHAAPGLGIGAVFLTGGEPMMYPRFDELVRIAGGIAASGVSMTVCTNATFVQPRDARLFAELGFNVHVSIDGAPAYHDAFRRSSGAFAKAERGVDLLVTAGVPVTIVTTICQANLGQFHDIANWAIGHGAIRLLVQPLLDLGRGAAIADERLTPGQLLTLIMMTSDLANGASAGRQIKASIIGGNKRFFLAHPCAAYVCNGGGCHRGVSKEIKKVVVREDGTVLPEATNLNPRYAIGQASEASLADMIPRFLSEGYAAFDRLCRATYNDYVPTWPDPILPWDQLLSERSWLELPDGAHQIEGGCGSVASVVSAQA